MYDGGSKLCYLSWKSITCCLAKVIFVLRFCRLHDAIECITHDFTASVASTALGQLATTIFQIIEKCVVAIVEGSLRAAKTMAPVTDVAVALIVRVASLVGHVEALFFVLELCRVEPSKLPHIYGHVKTQPVRIAHSCVWTALIGLFFRLSAQKRARKEANLACEHHGVAAERNHTEKASYCAQDGGVFSDHDGLAVKMRTLVTEGKR